jgi:hypothetical protein
MTNEKAVYPAIYAVWKWHTEVKPSMQEVRP